jgi:two-component system phosphate regulon sensor histidine kinase PhoR
MVAAVTAIAAGSLILTGFAVWQHRDIGTAWSLVSSACCIVGAMGAVWLGFGWLKLVKAIASIAPQLELKAENPEDKLKPVDFSGKRGLFASLRMTATEQLGEAIVKRLDGYRIYTSELEKQVKDLQIQIQLIQRQRRHAEAIIYSIRDAVVVVDEFDRLLMANEAAGRLFNFDFESSQHKPVDELIDAGKDEFVDFLRQSRQSKVRATRREIELSEDGNLKTFDCIVSCVYEGKEKVCGVVAVLHDVTREKEISRMKNDFVSHVSHELKTPLASITAYSEMLSDGEADDEETRKEFYSVIQGQAERLNRLIDDILNISRIESGLIKVDKRPVSLTILIEEQLQMIKSAANEKNIEIIGQKPIVFDQVYVDKDMISQVVVNLLSNAVKYTRRGGSIKIETSVDEIAKLARVSITDTGVGIPEDEVEHVFDKFYRVDANKSCAKGTGLGLNLVKQIVEKVHDGRVFVTSRVGVGSTFGFELPLASGQPVKV